MPCCPQLWGFLKQHRRLLGAVLVILLFLYLGQHARQVSMPGMCHVYG